MQVDGEDAAKHLPKVLRKERALAVCTFETRFEVVT